MSLCIKFGKSTCFHAQNNPNKKKLKMQNPPVQFTALSAKGRNSVIFSVRMVKVLTVQITYF